MLWVNFMGWEELKKGTLSIGKFEGYEICYDASKKEFLAYVKDEILRAKSQQLLERQIKEVLEVKFDKVIEVSKYHIAPPQVIQVVKRGNRFFMIDGKLKATDYYDLHQYNEEVFKELTELAKQYGEIEEKWRRLVDGLPNIH